MEDSPLELPVFKVQLISAIKAGGRRKESNIGDTNYRAYFKTKHGKAIIILYECLQKKSSKETGFKYV